MRSNTVLVAVALLAVIGKSCCCGVPALRPVFGNLFAVVSKPRRSYVQAAYKCLVTSCRLVSRCLLSLQGADLPLAFCRVRRL